jgi:hypothetical protein
MGCIYEVRHVGAPVILEWLTISVSYIRLVSYRKRIILTCASCEILTQIPL